MWLSLRTTLYHGTASEIQQVDVKLGRERKDFHLCGWDIVRSGNKTMEI